MDEAMRIAKSMESELHAFVFDARIIDKRRVNEIISKIGASGLLSKWEEQGLVVYYINRKKVAKRCLYEECTGFDGPQRDRCIESCIHDTISKLANSIAGSVMELAGDGRRIVAIKES